MPWPAEARDALIALLGAGHAAIGVWEALDEEGLVTALIPDWERVRNRPQRNPLHTFTVDRHLVETAAYAAALTRDVARPDLLLVACLLHDLGKGWPGDHSVSGEVVARDVAHRVGFPDADAELVARAARHHLLLPMVATRRDLDDPVTVEQVARTLGGRPLLELLHALAAADGMATGPAAWNDWKPAGFLPGQGWRRCSPAIRRRAPGRCARISWRWPKPAARPLSSRVTRSRSWLRPARPAVAGGWCARLAPAHGPRRQRHVDRAHRGRGLQRRAGVR